MQKLILDTGDLEMNETLILKDFIFQKGDLVSIQLHKQWILKDVQISQIPDPRILMLNEILKTTECNPSFYT